MRLIALLALLCACGSSNSGSNNNGVGGTKDGWTTDNINATEKSCIDAVILDNSNTSAGAAANYCGCVTEATDHRWTYDDWTANANSYTQQLKADGTIANCQKQASGS